MKRFLIITTISLITFSNAEAAIPATNPMPMQISVPSMYSGMEFSIAGLYLKPSSVDLNYATITTPTSGLSSTTQIQAVHPDSHLGFRVGIGYVFANSGNDIHLSWANFNESDANTTVLTPGQVLTTRNGQTVAVNSAAATGEVEYNDNIFDLDVGQHIRVGSRMYVRLFGGLRFADTETKSTLTYVGTASANNVNLNQLETVDTTFQGMGPRFGMQSTYLIGHGIGVTAVGAGALLIGTVDADVSVHSEIGDQLQVTNQIRDTVHRVVPDFDSRLGLVYTHFFQNHSHTLLNIEGGYQISQPVGAVTTANVSFDGPYVLLHVKV